MKEIIGLVAMLMTFGLLAIEIYIVALLKKYDIGEYHDK